MSRWGELIPHDEDDENCLCGCRDEEPYDVPSEGDSMTVHCSDDA